MICRLSETMRSHHLGCFYSKQWIFCFMAFRCFSKLACFCSCLVFFLVGRRLVCRGRCHFVFYTQYFGAFLIHYHFRRLRLYGKSCFLMDRIFKGLGLSGKAFIPLVSCFGCAVPGIMATKTLESEKERRITIMLAPFFRAGQNYRFGRRLQRYCSAVNMPI